MTEVLTSGWPYLKQGSAVALFSKTFLGNKYRVCTNLRHILQFDGREHGFARHRHSKAEDAGRYVGWQWQQRVLLQFSIRGRRLPLTWIEVCAPSREDRKST